VKINNRLSVQVRTLFDAATRGEEVIVERDGQPDLRVMLQSEYVALVGAREPSSAAAHNPEASPEAPAVEAPRASVPKVPPGAVPGPPLNDQLAAEELVASIVAHKIGWEPWWKCSLPDVTVRYPDLAQLQLEDRVAAAYGWHRDHSGDDAPRLRTGLAVRLGLAAPRQAPNLTVTWTRGA
jgi:hypothetical protein